MKALISVSDKTGIETLAKGLVELGYEIISTGGTHKAIEAAGIPVTAIDDVTGFPEMMDGRVKTLHPLIHGGLLARRDDAAHMASAAEHGIGMIDLVVVNLYPFEATIAKAGVTLEDAIENIDIGGPSMVRSASKNYRSVGVVVNPTRYADILAEMKQSGGTLSDATRADLAVEAFTHTAQYDTAISNYLRGKLNDAPQVPTLSLTHIDTLRYGENPHQSAEFYQLGTTPTGLAGITQLHGKELSYNNIVDLEAAWLISREFDTPAAAVIKHTNPCGAAIADSIESAYQLAHDADPVSAFGSIIGLNRPVTQALAQDISKTFVEAIIAPSFEQGALDILMQKQAIRLITINPFVPETSAPVYKFVEGGVLRQGQDDIVVKEDQLSVATKRRPTPEESKDLHFAFAICKHVKSNAIVIVKDGVAVGVGAGQMSRVESAEIAIKRAGDRVKGAVVGSDAFFPFRDSVDLLAGAGVRAIIQPGGSKRDDESIVAADENDMAMVITGIRHFKH
ncbi:MAG: bifunctional phosphoribosylaminoimidazolecarboxamide formyltransferase/IMP cyclohydrolase [bacterium]|nr:bifunctional phosphoribosylaminoimidazolecarboxamide formyltransferase/IMP cyclohydrolase [bacterium]